MYVYPRKCSRQVSYVALALLLCVVAVESRAHHSFAMFDDTKEKVVSGTVTEFQFSNPHIYFKVAVVETGGAKPVSYLFEGPTPVILKRLGWTGSTLKPGARIKVRMQPLRSGKPGGHALRVWLENGKEMSLVAEDIKYK